MLPTGFEERSAPANKNCSGLEFPWRPQTTSQFTQQCRTRYNSDVISGKVVRVQTLWGFVNQFDGGSDFVNCLANDS